MEYSIIVNQPMCVKYGLNYQQGAQLEFLGKLSTWATSFIQDKEVYYNITFEKIKEELPLVFKNKDKAYRTFLEIKKKGLVEQIKVGKCQHNYVRLSAKGKKILRFEKNYEPNQGSRNFTTRLEKNYEPQNCPQSIENIENTDQGSRNFTTYHNQLTNTSERDARAWDFLLCKNTLEMEAWQMQNKIQDFEKFKEDFNDTVDIENHPYEYKILKARLNKYARNWIANGNRFKVIKTSSEPVLKRKRIG